MCAVALSALCIVVNAQVKDPFVHNMDDTLSTVVGDMNDYHGSVSLGLIDGRVNIQGPIIKGRTSFNLAYRRSWMDMMIWLAMKIYGDDGSRKAAYFMNDLNAGSKDAAVCYGLEVYSVSEEFYRYSLALYKSKRDFLAQMGLAPAQLAWSNMDSGFGFCGAVNRCFYLEFAREDILVLAAE